MHAPRLYILACTLIVFCGISTLSAASPSPTPEQIAFFEKKIRPVLVEHCYKCHSTQAAKKRGGLYLDSRDALLKGGDGGPALVPGKPEKSKLIEAVRYSNVDLQMPPKGKLSQQVIDDLTAWVKMDAPWPGNASTVITKEKGFDLQARKASHWSWKPIQAVTPPVLNNTKGVDSPIDRFLSAKLREKGLKPAPAVDRYTLLRRLSFDLIGLPPTPKEIEAFVRDTSDKALENVVDRLLASPQFGERWARHWLDLVRYAETRGHEFDFNIPGAHHYRDGIIRAFNADVPYNQLVREHLAGDLLKTPRLHPEKGFNESLLMTAFWFLGEEVHSPVDIRADQADRFDNRIDVMSKTFLGLTVACARCHDHKFDAISTKDYYALYGVLSSSNYRLARFETSEQNRRCADELATLRQKYHREILRDLAGALRPQLSHMADYLLAVEQAVKDTGLSPRTIPGDLPRIDPDRIKKIAEARKLNAELLTRWVEKLSAVAREPKDPLYPVARWLALGSQRKAQEILSPLVAAMKQQRLPDDLPGEVIIDYRRPTKQPWLTDGPTFGTSATTAGQLFVEGTPAEPKVQFASMDAGTVDPFWREVKLSIKGHNESGSLGQLVRAGSTLRTPTFKLTTSRVHYLARGVGMAYASVGSHILLAGPLHGRLIQRIATGNEWRWHSFDLTVYKGESTHLEFSAQPGADFAVACVIQDERSPAGRQPGNDALVRVLLGADSTKALIAGYQRLFTAVVVRMEKDQLTESVDAAGYATLANWMLANRGLFGETTLPKSVTSLLSEQGDLAKKVQRVSELVPAMQDGTGVDEYVFIRGQHRGHGDTVPRRFLEALYGTAPLAAKGSGRLELAEQMVDPKRNPFLTRVIVNRLWHHLFGRGIVPTVDDFGVMGMPPTHPELLDWLANRFVQDGWSIKKMIRLMVLTRAYQMSSQGDPEADKLDPDNQLWHRANLRRLEGETIRDAILALSGRLDRTMYGSPVAVYLTEFQQGRGRPGSGPLDGQGRRSIYLGVRRNFLSSFLLAFDVPQPFSTVGRRTVSNVPAQSLILMNDPFVHQQATHWAKKTLTGEATPAERIKQMYLSAFGRAPTEEEMSNCLEFVGSSREEKTWADLAHALINVKEFIFLR